MADKELKSISFPGLNDLYLIPPGSNVAPEYSPSSTYAVGDLRAHNGKLYQCNTTISTAEAWNSSHWTQVSLSDVMDTALDGKVDKEAGKGLSTEDYTTAEKTKLGALPTNADLETALGSKLDKRTGSGVEVYTHDGATQGGKSVTETPTAGAVPLYGTGGVLKAGAPTADNDVARKAEIDAVKENLDAITITDTASGAIASFSDGADSMPMKVVAEINPVQDLHGQDAPYPAGGGANLFDYNKATFVDSAYGFTITHTGDVITISGTANTTGALSFNIVSNYSDDTLSGMGYIVQAMDVSGNKTIGNIYGFRTVSEHAVAIRIDDVTSGDSVTISLKISVAATSQTTYSPYSNICPISGWTGLNLTRANSNFAIETHNGWNIYGDGKIYDNQPDFAMIIGKVKKGETYTATTDDPSLVCGFFETLPTVGDTTYDGARVIQSSKTFVAPINGYIVFRANYGYSVGTLNAGSAALPYKVPQNENISVDWQTEAGTVYGGTDEIVSGALVSKMKSIDLGTLDWIRISTSESTNKFRFRASVADVPVQTDGNETPNFLCSHYKTITPNQSYLRTATGITNNIGTSVVIVYDPAHETDTEEAFKAAMSGVQLVYESTQPVEYQLDPVTVSTLYGQNNIFADCGDVSVDYPCDTKLYLEKLTQPTEDDLIADHAITSGQFFMIGNTLYKATAAIANGATITVGTNAQQLSLADALNLLNT